MILPLRRVHRSAFVALAIFLPAVLASAWKTRRMPVLQQLPPELLPGLESYGVAFSDVLVYWIPTSSWCPIGGEVSSVPADAELIGTIRSGATAIVPPAGKQYITYTLPSPARNAE